MDEGFSQLVAGQILFELLPHCPGRNQGARVASLWEHMQSLYKAEGTPWEQRLPKLTLKDIHKPKSTPSLDCKAVHCRYFCKFLQKLTASKNFASKSLHCQAVHSLAKQIGLVYQHLEIFNADELAKAMEKAVKQYLALEQETLLLNPEESKLWHCLPKAHLCGHISDLVKQGANPKDSWNYTDETFACDHGARDRHPLSARRARKETMPALLRVRKARQFCVCPAREPKGSGAKCLILVGLEPTIPGSVGRCLIHWATGPLIGMAVISFNILLRRQNEENPAQDVAMY